ncbi:uncharacterized protein BT62DRAFT_1004269 [Guyanagaster necrorhizus]|uniref:Uncharacterized protein n=1 Tax=Guyanagaster necrorhizus TaxID=856835 RepID=A0A9P7VW35_9AGAR|nr:uncharacterized protein BT62DRAFT_1004269 [Guyanagaster necrorhizus MCA 3950]KAG7447525.1 hypothetical protein BT62DRAFT_1004269 [Guyanagaster necrorhizus MCA 3950]
MSAWSFPPTVHDDDSVRSGSTVNLHTQLLPFSTAVSRPPTPAISCAQVLGGYRYTPNHKDTEKNLRSLATTSGRLDISIYRAIGWSTIIWVPLHVLIDVVQNGPPSVEELPAVVVRPSSNVDYQAYEYRLSGNN